MKTGILEGNVSRANTSIVQRSFTVAAPVIWKRTSTDLHPPTRHNSPV